MSVPKKKEYSVEEILGMSVNSIKPDLSADYDSDGKITAADAREAARIAAGRNTETVANDGDDYSVMSRAVLDEIINRKPFSYDMNSDVLYEQYKNRYTQAGKKAAEDTLGATSALTGGYASSYGETAAAQAYYEYLNALGDVVPELSKQAYDAYNDSEDSLYDKLEAVRKLEGDEYEKFRDSVEDERYESEQTSKEREQKIEFAFDAAAKGDYSYVEALGIDTAMLKANAASELAVLMAKYGDYSGLTLLGIDTASLQKEETPEKINVSVQKNAENAYASGGKSALIKYLDKQIGYGQITQAGKQQIIAVLSGG